MKQKRKKITLNKSQEKIINEKIYGRDEPIFSKYINDSHYGKCLQWYNISCDVNDARKFIIEYLDVYDKDKIRIINHVPDAWINLTAAWIMRMITNGCDIQLKSRLFLNTKLEEMYAKSSINETEPEEKVTVRDRMKEKSMEILGEIEGELDKSDKFQLYEWLQANHIPPAYCNRIINKYKPILDEVRAALHRKDDQVVEGYRGYTKAQLIFLIQKYEHVIDDAERYSGNLKKTRKPRKSRPVSVEKKLKHFRYQKEDNDLKVVSIDPQKIIGAQELWTYNTKYKIITVFRALDRGGLQVHRSSITGYDEKNSQSKRTGRRGEILVDKCLNGGKLVLRKLMDDARTDSTLQHRINENTLLLRSL